MKPTEKRLVNYTASGRRLSVTSGTNLIFTGRIWCAMLLLFIFSNTVSAQDLTLPPTNLGMVNVLDGMDGKPGLIYQGYAQVFQTRKVLGDQGKDMHLNLKVNSIVYINQFIYQTPAIRIFISSNLV